MRQLKNPQAQPVVEPLEPRLLLDGALPGVLGAHPAGAEPVLDGGVLAVQIGDGAARSVRYEDADGTAVTVYLRKGWATLGFTGDDLQWTVTRSRVTVSGGDLELSDVLLRQTTQRSRLRVRAGRGGDRLAEVGRIAGSTPLGKLWARRARLVGEGIALTDDASIGVIGLHDLLNGADIRMPGVSERGVKIKANTIGDGSDLMVGSHLKKLQAAEWLDTDDSADLLAPTVGRMRIGGDFGADLLLGGDGDARYTLRGARIGGDLIDSAWDVTGQTGRVYIKGQTVATAEPQAVVNLNIPPADLADLVAGNNAFAFELYQLLSTDLENLFFSPYSISLALSMLYGGAAGATAVQMADALNFTLPQEQLHPAFGALNYQLDTPDSDAGDVSSPAGPEPELSIVNSVWGAEDVAYVSQYLDLLAENYGARMRRMDFLHAPEACRAIINQWVSDETNDKIPELLRFGSINPLTRLVLVNAMYFKAAWASEFDPQATHDAPFNSLDGTTGSVSMMAQTEYLAYAEGAGYQAVELPYANGTLSMLVLLPTTGQFEDFESALSAEAVDDIVADLQTSYVQLQMPKFEVRWNSSLIDSLTGLGMADAFVPGQADFTGIEQAGGLFVSDVTHEAVIRVDEQGTEAAAATGVIVSLTSNPPTPVVFTADRPFTYVIRDTETNATLFVGRVADAQSLSL